MHYSVDFVLRAFVGSTFSKPFNTSKTRVVISSFVRPAAAEKAARWGSHVRRGMAAAEAEIRFRAKLAAGPRKATRRKDILWAGVTRALRAVLPGVSGARLIPNTPSGNATDQCHVRRSARRDPPTPLYIWFSRQRQATVSPVRSFTHSKIQDLLKVRVIVNPRRSVSHHTCTLFPSLLLGELAGRVLSTIPLLTALSLPAT